MNKKLILGGCLAFVCTTVSSSAQTVSVVRPPFDGKAKMLAFLDPKAHKAPTGIPGYYDPATRQFTPLVPTNASGGLYEGLASWHPEWDEDDDLEADKEEDKADSGDGDGSVSEADQEPTSSSGKMATVLVTNGSESASPYSYSIEKPPTTISRQFSFASQGTNPMILPTFTARFYASNNVSHQTSITLPSQPLKSGNYTFTFQVNL